MSNGQGVTKNCKVLNRFEPCIYDLIRSCDLLQSSYYREIRFKDNRRRGDQQLPSVCWDFRSCGDTASCPKCLLIQFTAVINSRALFSDGSKIGVCVLLKCLFYGVFFHPSICFTYYFPYFLSHQNVSSIGKEYIYFFFRFCSLLFPSTQNTQSMCVVDS